MAESGSIILIIGTHPLVTSLEEQYASKCCCVTHIEAYSGEDVSQCDEIVLLTSAVDCDKVKEDNRMLNILYTIAQKMDPYSGKRPIVHLLLQSNHTLGMLQQLDLPDTVITVMDVYPFTLESQWARLLFAKLPGELPKLTFPPLDREPITGQSGKTVHLVLSGFTSQSQLLAIFAALVAHYPNYDSKSSTPLRTHITIISPGLESCYREFVARYRHLFANSYYSVINLQSNSSTVHYPQYYGRREDFVDVEWEFIDSDIYNDIIQDNLMMWAQSETEILTIAMSSGSDDRNVKDVLGLPEVIFNSGIPVLTHVSNLSSLSLLKASSKYNNVYAFGMNNIGYDVTIPLISMGKMLNAFYWGIIGVGNDHVDQHLIDDAWKSLPSFAKRFSNIYNVMTIPTKLRSVGHETTHFFDRCYLFSSAELDDLAAVEHNRWCVEELIMGFRPCSDEELIKVEKNIEEFLLIKDDPARLATWELRDKRGHPCTLKEIFKEDELKRAHYDLRCYSDLRVDLTGVNVQYYDKHLTRCIPVLASKFLLNE